jgi:hypothetical protein
MHAPRCAGRKPATEVTDRQRAIQRAVHEAVIVLAAKRQSILAGESVQPEPNREVLLHGIRDTSPDVIDGTVRLDAFFITNGIRAEDLSTAYARGPRAIEERRGMAREPSCRPAIQIGNRAVIVLSVDGPEVTVRNSGSYWK